MHRNDFIHDMFASRTYFNLIINKIIKKINCKIETYLCLNFACICKRWKWRIKIIISYSIPWSVEKIWGKIAFSTKNFPRRSLTLNCPSVLPCRIEFCFQIWSCLGNQLFGQSNALNDYREFGLVVLLIEISDIFQIRFV